MNERVKALAEQATQKFSRFGERDSWEKLFAELIVRECANFVQFYYKDHACEGIAHDMKEHFGVE